MATWHLPAALRRAGIPFRKLDHAPEVQLNCPLCGDTRKRLYFNLEKGIGWCHNESQSITLADLAQCVPSLNRTVLPTRTRINLCLEELHRAHQAQTRRLDSMSGETECHRIALPDDYLPIRSRSRACAYLKNRGFTEETIKRYQIGYCPKGPYYGRIIIPIEDETGMIASFSARDYLGTQYPKYLFPPGCKIAHFVFRLSRLPSTVREVILVEGQMSALKFERNVCATFGKKVSYEQAALLKRRGIRSIVLCFDADAWEQSKRIAKWLARQFSVSLLKLRTVPQPDHLSVDGFWQAVRTRTVWWRCAL